MTPQEISTHLEMIKGRERIKKLQEEWKQNCPLAVAETPWKFPNKLEMLEDNGSRIVLGNDVYNVSVYFVEDTMFKTDGVYQINVSRVDGCAVRDWRDLQWIKNCIVGPEGEGLELFPSESRLLDPSNMYTIWAWNNTKIKLGKFEKRRVWNADVAIAPQRGFNLENLEDDKSQEVNAE